MANNFTVSGFEPTGEPNWWSSTPAQRTAFYRVAREIILLAYDRQLEAGLDYAGNPLAPLAGRTARYRKSAMGPVDKFAPPLTPAHQLSRTRAWCDARVEGGLIRVFWRNRWGLILGYHRQGNASLPVRDVFGLGMAGKNSAIAQCLLWWRAFSRGLLVRAPIRARGGRPARPLVAQVPEYEPRNTPAQHSSQTPAKHLAGAGSTQQIAIGQDIYTLTGKQAKSILRAVHRGEFAGWKSLE